MPGSGISGGGLQEYWVISRSAHFLRSMEGLLRRFSWKLRWTVLTWSGRVSTEKTGMTGAILLYYYYVLWN